MAALTIAQNTLSQETRDFPSPQPKVQELLSYILKKYEVIDPATSTVPTVESILADQDLRDLLIQMGKLSLKKSSPKKASGAKAPKVSDTDRNSQEYDSCRCCARIWKAEGGLGFDNIQCNSKNMVTAEEAKKLLLALEPTPNEEEVDKFLESYEGTYCKKHMSQDFMMPKGYWLGKVNEKRPEEPMLPSGSIKKGYTEEYKPHQWMFDENGEKVEKKSSRRGCSKKKKVEEKVEEKVEVEPPQPNSVEEKEQAEFLAWKEAKKKNEQKNEVVDVDEVVVEVQEKVEEDDGEQKEAVTDRPPLDVDESKDSSDEEEYEDSEYIVDGVEYIKHWDEDEKVWIILEPEEYSKVGVPTEGGIEWDNDDEERKHEAKAENL